MTPNAWHECRAAALNTVCALFYREGLCLLVLRGPHSLCSYVGIPADHPLAGAGYELLPVKVCGGLNFEGVHGEGFNEIFPRGFYFYGWSHDHRIDASFDRDPRPEETLWDVPMCCLELEAAAIEFTSAMKLAKHAAKRELARVRYEARVAQLTLAQSVIAELTTGLGVEHEDPECPMDDTCECKNVARINAAMEGYQP